MTRPVILLVEDNEANQMLARAVLELDGFEVRVAGSAEEARAELRAGTLCLWSLPRPAAPGTP